MKIREFKVEQHENEAVRLSQVCAEGVHLDYSKKPGRLPGEIDERYQVRKACDGTCYAAQDTGAPPDILRLTRAFNAYRARGYYSMSTWHSLRGSILCI